MSLRAWDAKLLANPHAAADKPRRVRAMFAAIAPRYDLNNRLHSLWLDQYWRRRAVAAAEVRPGDTVVDVACGTGDLAAAFARFSSAGPIFGIDFTYEMLPLARDKTRQRARYVAADALCLPLPDQCCDVVSIAFGIRNVMDPGRALREFARILRPGGRLVILEFGLPKNPILRRLYNGYFRHILPRTAALIARDRTGAYAYLPQSVNTFISPEAMLAAMRSAGFANAYSDALTLGICRLYAGCKV